jgi:hypothetical protein
MHLEFWWENQRQREELIDLVVDERIILNGVLKNRLKVEDWIYVV